MKLKGFFDEYIYFCLFNSVHPQTIPSMVDFALYKLEHCLTS